jgi:hypothetical protein
VVAKIVGSVFALVSEDEFQKRLDAAKTAIVQRLRKGVCSGKELEKHVLSTTKPKRRNISAIHKLAFVAAYKELELDKKIKVTRGFGVAFPMTDFETRFEVFQ